LTVAKGFVEASGRGADLALTKRRPKAWQKCDLVNRPTVIEDGSLLMCCNTVDYADGSAGLKLGSLCDSPLDALLSQHASDPIVNFLRAFGPKFLLELDDRLRGVVDKPFYPEDKCASCRVLMQDQERLKHLRERLLQ